MTSLSRLIYILVFVFFGGIAMAQTADPAKTAFGVEMDVTGVNLDIRINDVPLFGVVKPANPFDARGVHFLRFNAALLPGPNEISVRYSEIPEPMMDGMWVKLRLSYREAGTFPNPFSGDNYALELVGHLVAAVVDAARHQRFVRVTVEELDQHFHPHARDNHAAQT